MRKFYLIFFLFTTSLFAQDIIVDFQGINTNTNANVTLDKVIIDNLTTGKTITVEDAAILNLSETLSTDDFLVTELNRGIITVYPNPVKTKATILVNSLGHGKSTIIVYDMNGKEIVSLQEQLITGQNSIEFAPGSGGIYFVQFIDSGKTYHSKVLATKADNGLPSLTLLNTFSKREVITSQKTLEDSFFTAGDVLRYTGFSGDDKAIVYDSPKVSKTYTFNFDNNFFRFETYLVESNYSSFVDVMFSVTDSDFKGVDYLDNDDFKVLENGSEVGTSESFRYIRKFDQVPSSQKTVLMLDKSFSVRDNLSAIKTAAISLVNKIAPNQEVAIYAFDENPTLLVDFTSDLTLLEAAINSIEAGFPSTNLYGSVITGLNKFNNVYTLEGIE